MAESRTSSDRQDDLQILRRRIALADGACGEWDRLVIRGQVVEIPTTAALNEEPWDYHGNISLSFADRIRPMVDLKMSRVVSARLQLEIIPSGNYSEPDQIAPLLRSEPFTARDDSFFHYRLREPLPPGLYLVRILERSPLNLPDSVHTAFTNATSSVEVGSMLAERHPPGSVIGYGKLQILAPDYNGYIITSDIDQTFLDTNLKSRQGLMETLLETPEMKRPYPGMVRLYRQLRWDVEMLRPLFFISASPHFFRRTFSKLFDLHDLDYSGLNLKYLAGTVDSVVRKGSDVLSHIDGLLRGGLGRSLGRAFKFLGSSYHSFFDQVSYKLLALLQNRLMQPSGAREILLGDNTESDYFIFTLYQHILLGHIGGAELENYLYRLQFHKREAMTRDIAAKIASLAELNRIRHGRTNPVTANWINLAYAETSEAKMILDIEKSLPANLRPIAREAATSGSVVQPRGCEGAAGFSLAAWDEGLVQRDQVAGIWHELVGQRHGDIEIDAAYLAALFDRFDFRRRSADEVAALRALVRVE